MVYNNLTPLPEFDGTQVGQGGQGGKAGGQGQGSGQSKSDMLNEAAEQLATETINGYQDTMDKIAETDWTQQVKQDMSGQPMSNSNGSEFSDLTPQQAKTLTNALKRQKEFMNNQQKKFGRLTKKDSRIVQTMEESDNTS